VRPHFVEKPFRLGTQGDDYLKAVGVVDEAAVPPSVELPSASSNPLPGDGLFSRVMPRKYADAFVRGDGTLGGGEEVFVGAAEDLMRVTTVREAQSRLSLFANEAGTLPNLAGDAVVTFRLRDITRVGLRSPIETSPPRGYGFVHGGRTGGGAREWLFNNGTASQLGAYDLRISILQ